MKLNYMISNIHASKKNKPMMGLKEGMLLKQSLAGNRPGLAQLKNNIEKNKRMVRKAAPVTGENKGLSELEAIGEALYQKSQIEEKKSSRSIFSRLIKKS